MENIMHIIHITSKGKMMDTLEKFYIYREREREREKPTTKSTTS
jgi:hypothetical protein